MSWKKRFFVNFVFSPRGYHSLLNSYELGDIRIAQRCAAATGDVATSKFLSEVKDIKLKAEEDMGYRASDHYLVRSKLALLRKDLKGINSIF